MNYLTALFLILQTMAHFENFDSVEGHQLSGSSNRGTRKCSSPYLDKTVNYLLSADAFWNFGSHGAGLTDTKLGATLSLSTTRHFERGRAGWIHNLTISAMHLASPIRGQFGQSPSENANSDYFLQALFTQFNCDELNSMTFSEGLDPTALNFLQSVASTIPFTIPSENIPEYSLAQQDGWHGPHTSSHSVRYWRDSSGEENSEIRSEININDGDLFLRGGEVSRNVRKENAVTLSLFRGGVMVKSHTRTATILGSPLTHREAKDKPELEEKLKISARGDSTLTFLSFNYAQPSFSQRATRKLLSGPGIRTVPFFSPFFSSPRVSEVCKDETEHSCFKSLLRACLGNATGANSSSQLSYSRDAIRDLITLLRASSIGLQTLTSSALQEDSTQCGPRSRVLLHALATLGTTEAQSVLGDILSNVSSFGRNSEACLHDTLMEISLVRSPTDKLFRLVLRMAEPFATGRADSSAAMALLALAAIGRGASATLRSVVVSVLVGKLEAALRRDGAYDAIHTELLRKAEDAFQSSSGRMKLALLMKTRQLSSKELSDEWAQSSDTERMQWEQEAIRCIVLQVSQFGMAI
jgi:hypothetical protein